MTRRYEMPGRIDRQSRFFTLFTAPDLIRVSLPLAAAYLATGSMTTGMEMAAMYTAAVFVSVTWWLGKPFGQHLDTLVYHVVRWLLAKRGIEGMDVEELKLGYVFTADEAAVAFFEIEPVNLEMQSQTDQGVLHDRYQSLFRTVSFPVYVYSRQQPLDLSDHIEFVKKQAGHHEELKREYIEYVRKLSAGNHTATRHFVAIRVKRGGKHWLYDHLPDRVADRLPIENGEKRGEQAQITELQERCRTVRRTLTSSNLSVTGIAGRELHELVGKFNETNPGPSVKWTTQPSGEDGEYRRSAYLHEFRRKQRLGWPLDLLRIGGKVDIVQRVEPRDRRTAKRKLNRLKVKLNAEIASFLAQGHLGTHDLERLEEDVDDISELLAEGEDVLVDYSATVTAHSEDREQCVRTFEDVCEELEAKEIEYRQPVYRTDHAYRSDSPLYGDGLNESFLLPATSAAAGFSAATQEPEQSGLAYGVGVNDESPVILDRWSWPSHSMARMGTVGSGKSYAGKLELLRANLVYDDLQIYVVDPKQEYVDIVGYLGGSVYTLGEDDLRFDGNDIIGYQVAERAQQENVELLADAVQRIYHSASQDQRKTLVLIDEARKLLKDEWGRQVLNEFVLEGRDTNSAVTLITQNASHFTRYEDGKEILRNMPGIVLMKHKEVDSSVTDFFDLSPQEKQELYGLKTGTDADFSEALIKVEGRLDSKIRVEASDGEHHIIEELDSREQQSESSGAVETKLDTTNTGADD